MPTKIVVLEGPIAAGKSSLLNRLKSSVEDTELLFVEEPVEKWTELLTYFYGKKKGALALQTYIAATQFEKLNEALQAKPKLIVTDRYIDSSLFTYVPVLKKEGWISESDKESLEIILEQYKNCLPPHEVYRYFLGTDMDICQQRIQKRGRAFEQQVKYDYLSSLESAYIQWRQKFPKSKYQVIHINNKDDVEKVVKNLKESLE